MRWTEVRHEVIVRVQRKRGLFNAVTDSIHKVVSPSTYECRLCYYTHELARMRKPLKRFLESLDQPMAFIHRNEFWRDYAGHDIELPSILVEADGKLEIGPPPGH